MTLIHGFVASNFSKWACVYGGVNMRKYVCRFLAVLLMFGTSCMSDQDAGLRIISFSFDFDEGDHGWQPGFSDFPANLTDSSIYELEYAYTLHPIAIEDHDKAFMLSGHNRSDDLFMFLKKKIDNLEPNTEYTVTFQVAFSSSAREGFAGIGGAPGESVFMKVGAVAREPKAVIEGSDVVMNLDKGNQSQGGVDMITIGNVATPASYSDYAPIIRSNGPTSNGNNSTSYRVRTNAQGEAWLIVGTDSGFEGKTIIYYNVISAVFSRTD